jgi:DNA-binding transcriptional ArsR family regulator
MPPSAIRITLSDAQVAEVVESATAGDSPAMLLRGLADPAAILEMTDNSRISRSLLRGFVVLAALPRDRTGIGVIQIASQIDASPSTTHRYLTTLVELGLVERDARSRRYRLSDFAVRAKSDDDS